MKITALLLTAALLLPVAGTFAQSVSLALAAPDATFATAGSVTYFGTSNSHDAHHEQFAQLRQAFEQARPTVVFFEKPDVGIDSTEATTIAQMGASGYARFLAQQHQVPAERLDDVPAEYAYLATKLEPEQLQLYWLLRQAQQFRQNTGASKAFMMQAATAFIASIAHHQPGTPQRIHTPAELQAAYRKYCPASGQWWQVPTASFATQPPAAGTNQQFITDITRTVTAFRTERLARKVATAVQAGQRVLVVLDRDYLPTEALPAYAARPLPGR